ncbi:MAG: lipase family protein [Actinomycetota bacterium]
MSGSATAVVVLDPQTTLALAAASLAAYDDWRTPDRFTPPANYRLAGRFTGWSSLGEERFGLVFVGSLRTNNTRYIVAFRGTDSLGDIFDDAEWGKTNFVPYRNSISPDPEVHSGFYAVYSRRPIASGRPMRQQVFELLPPSSTEVLVTGHSLGAALAQLFVLDYRVSLQRGNVRSINFASPRVGGRNWQLAFDASGAAAVTVRVINFWDYVPEYPPVSAGYGSVGAEFLTAFAGPWWSTPIDELPRHSLANLNYVLNSCVWLSPQIWVGSFLDKYYGCYDMSSTKPPAAAKDTLVTKIEEWKQAEKSVVTRTEEA